MVSHASSLPDEEVVGAVMEDGFVVKLRNEAKDRANSFAISPSQLTHLDSLVAVYHSHPGGSELISVTDEEGLRPLPAVIVTLNSVILWWYADHLNMYYRIWDRHYGVE